MRPLAVDAAAAAELLGVSESTLHALRKRPGFPAGRKVGERAVRWAVSELEAWLIAQPAAVDEEPPKLKSRRFKCGVEVGRQA